jgi:UDP-N-acetyl-alpha-D-muramoyl-L-alanyl-L-glutamate epimerase
MEFKNSFNEKYQDLKNRYPVFHFDQYKLQISNQELQIIFQFHSEELYFSPKVKLFFGNYLKNDLNESFIKGFIFNIGMIELISYWKSVGSPILMIHPFQLDTTQENWWKKLYFKGLGEFFYQNKLEVDKDSFLNFKYDSKAPSYQTLIFPKVLLKDRVLIPIGGGKDSVVTLEHFKEKQEIVPFIINPRGATLDCAKIAGFDTKNKIFIIERQIDPQLLELNKQGYLNGHTPFSAMLAFYSALTGYITNSREIALSNESSANESTILGTEINHQYSKSLEFENDFQEYVFKYMNDSVHYYSYLRPFSELEIARMFSNYTSYHPVFKSCNAGSKENRWCCNCSKCLFAFIILSPYIANNKLIEIFGEDLLDKKELLPYFEELTGIADQKPFECVGTIDEVNEAIQLVINQLEDKYLIQKYIEHKNSER